jgi:hypothetical protein
MLEDELSENKDYLFFDVDNDDYEGPHYEEL